MCGDNLLKDCPFSIEGTTNRKGYWHLNNK